MAAGNPGGVMGAGRMPCEASAGLVGQCTALAVGLAMTLSATGCVTTLPASPTDLTASENIAFGRVQVQLSGPTSRAYLPAVRFFEVVHRSTRERYRVEIGSAESSMFLRLPPGEYELSRVMINEGAFQASANPEPIFEVVEGGLTYLGTWQFAVSSPNYERRMKVSNAHDLEGATQDLRARYPELANERITARRLDPESSETRLYEVRPYPLFRYFRRQPTS